MDSFFHNQLFQFIIKIFHSNSSASHKQLIFIVAIQPANNYCSQLDLVHENRKKEQGLCIYHPKKYSF